MNQSPTELPEPLRSRFPNMRPVKKSPVLTTVNGIGFTMYGKRDVDTETGTYIKTHVFCVVFVPLFSIAAYRVADAEKGWYFLGKERLSTFARNWNWIVLCLLFAAAGIVANSTYTASPQYQAKQALKRADAELAKGNVLHAANLYHQAAQGEALQDQAWKGLGTSLQQCVTNASGPTVEGAFRILSAVKARGGSVEAVMPGAYERGLQAVERFRVQPEVALDILAPVRQLGPATNAPLDEIQAGLLRAAIATKADNTNRVVELALLHERRQEMKEAVAVLTPYREKLGATEGARILGRHLLGERKHEEAYALLFPYVQQRLDRLHTIESHYTNATASAYERGLAFLREGKADQSFYQQYEKAGEAQRQDMVGEFLHDWVQADPQMQRAVAELREANEIVHVTLDLGIVQLTRAQSLTDAAARKTELEAAEKTFLAIRGLAGDTDEYRMFLGQVYYWLGKAPQGKELFDQLLAANQRADTILLALGRTLREVGEDEQARALLEEAYRNAKSQEIKFVAASIRARVEKDVDDQIAWLEKSDTSEASVQAALSNARGEKALRDGDEAAAGRHLRAAVEAYGKLPEDPAMLNNCGLAWLSLFRVTGNVEDYTRGLHLLEQALALSPGNSVLLINVAHLFINRAYMDVVGDSIHYAALRETPGPEMLRFLYRDEAGRTTVYEKLREDQYLKQGMTYLNKALLLAPKSGGPYGMALGVHAGFRDLAELEKLEQRLHLAAPDLSLVREEMLELYGGTKNKQYLEQHRANLNRYEKLLGSDAVKNHEPTLNFATLELISIRHALAMMGEPAEPRRALEQSQALLARHDSSGNSAHVAAMYFWVADDDLRRREPAYAAIADRTRMSLAPRQLIAFLLERDTQLGGKVRSNALVKEALEAVKVYSNRFPKTRDIDEWAMFRIVDPKQAALVAESCQENKSGQLRDRLQFELNPLSASAVLEQYWYRKLGNDRAGAEALYREAVSKGVPLPE